MRSACCLAGIALSLGLSASASAQSAVTWTGFYVGAHIGGGWTAQDWNQIDNNQGNALDHSADTARTGRALGGLQAGYNRQISRLVFGLEGDWTWTSAETCAPLVVFPDYSNCTRTTGYGTLTGRAGYTWNSLLAYVKGGGALTTAKYFAIFYGPGGASVDTATTRQMSVGWTLGAGVEYALDRSWSLKAEYGYLDFGRPTVELNYLPGGSSPGLIEHWQVRSTAHLVKLGVNYRLPVP
jgi:outer membrane immunogenic protein